MARQFGTAHIHGLSGASIACTGFIDPAPNIQSASIDHNADVDEVKNQAGNVAGLIGNNEVVSVTLECIPQDVAGGSAATLADAIKSAWLPPVPSAITTSGFQDISIGATTNALNGLFFYLGGGRINALADGKWTMSLPIRRYPAITNGTVLA